MTSVPLMLGALTALSLTLALIFGILARHFRQRFLETRLIATQQREEAATLKAALAEAGHALLESQAAQDRLADFQTLFDALPYPAWRRAPDLRIVYANRAFVQMMDLPLDAILREGREISAAARALARRAQKLGLLQSESQQVIVGGERRLYDLCELPAIDGSLIGYALDQTALEETHAALTRHLAAHDDVLQSLGTGIVIFGPDKRLKFFNAAYCDQFGLDAQFLRQEPSIGEVFDHLRERKQLAEQADFRSYKQELIHHLMRLIEPYEDLVHTPAGATFRMVATPHPLGGVILTYEDVTDRLALETNYNTLIEVQKETLDHLYEGIAVFGSDGRLKLYNPAFLALWKLSAEDVAGEPHIARIVDFARPFFDKQENWEVLRQRVIGEVIDRNLHSVRWERNDGKAIEVSAIPLPDGGRLYKYTDITAALNVERALRERNEALVAAEKLKAEFIANVSYEFRTPLNAIIGYAELLDRQYFGPLNERQSEYSGAILEAAQSLMLLVGDVIDVAAIEAGYIKLEHSVVDLQQLLEWTARLFQQRATATGVALLVDCPPDVGAITADLQRLRQALGNLISNAISQSPSGGTVRIAAAWHGGELYLSVRQSGLPRIPVARSNAANDLDGGLNDGGLNDAPGVHEPAPGRNAAAGLGMALATTLVRLHGGRVVTEAGVENGVGWRESVCILPSGKQDATPAAIH